MEQARAQLRENARVRVRVCARSKLSANETPTRKWQRRGPPSAPDRLLGCPLLREGRWQERKPGREPLRRESAQRCTLRVTGRFCACRNGQRNSVALPEVRLRRKIALKLTGRHVALLSSSNKIVSSMTLRHARKDGYSGLFFVWSPTMHAYIEKGGVTTII